jgi:hypothetical protein
VNDRATQEEEFAIELRTRDRERKLIRKIEQSLKRFKTMITVSVKLVVSKLVTPFRSSSNSDFMYRLQNFG